MLRTHLFCERTCTVLRTHGVSATPCTYAQNARTFGLILSIGFVIWIFSDCSNVWQQWEIVRHAISVPRNKPWEYFSCIFNEIVCARCCRHTCFGSVRARCCGHSVSATPCTYALKKLGYSTAWVLSWTFYIPYRIGYNHPGIDQAQVQQLTLFH